MKFENIKVGDTVFFKDSVAYSWNGGKDFFIPQKVIKVTKKQFTLENKEKCRKGNQTGD